VGLLRKGNPLARIRRFWHLNALFCSLFPTPYSLILPPGLLPWRRYANLSSCAVERAEWQCARAVFKGSGAVSGWIGLA
jgi:hypothetical protein